MPYLHIRTNRSLDPDASRALLDEASREIAAALGKAERYVMVDLDCGQAMRFAGSDDPLAYVELKSIGLPQQRTAELSSAVCRLLGRHADIAADRIYIEFADAERHLWGWNGATF